MAADYPLAGRGAAFVLPDGMRIEHRYETAGRFRYSVSGGSFDGLTGVTEQTVTPLRPGQFLTSWSEDNGTRVVHVEDFDALTYESVVVTGDGHLFGMAGTIELLD